MGAVTYARMTVAETDQRERLAAEASRVRASGSLGRSEPLLQLFDFLLGRSLEGRVPKEIEIAQEVFNKTADFDGMQDASVRVYVHRLRRKLDEHYVRASVDGDRLALPLGEYRLVLSDGPAPIENAAPAEPIEAPPRRWVQRFWIVAALLAAINIVGWTLYLGRAPADATTAWSRFWKPLVESKRPTFIVTGDYYIFGEAPDRTTVSRLVRDFTINSRSDLDEHLMANPEDIGRYVDVNLHYLPVSVGTALRSLVPVINAATLPSGVRPQVIGTSDLKPEILKNANVVYIGYLSGLGLLRDPVFAASGFKIGDNYDQLIDKANGRRFSSDWAMVAAGQVPRRDYGYVASLPGPAGNRILIIAGTRDAAVSQMAEVAADKQQLAAIDAKGGEGAAFEALFDVRTVGNANLGSSLVLVRPLRADNIWRP